MSLIRDPKAEWSAQAAEEQRRADDLHWRRRQSQAGSGDSEIPTSRARQIVIWVVIALVVLSVAAVVLVFAAGGRT